MFRKLRMRAAAWLSPQLAGYAESHLAAGRTVMESQRLIVAQTDLLRQRGFKGTVIDYQNGLSFARIGIHLKNKRAMETLYLPSPPTIQEMSE